MSFPRFAVLAVNLTHLKPGKQSLCDRESSSNYRLTVLMEKNVSFKVFP